MREFDINRLDNEECRELLSIIHNRLKSYDLLIEESIVTDRFDNLRMVINQANFDFMKTVSLDFKTYKK